MATVVRTPVHLWIVGILSACWNAFGAVDYVMTQTRNASWLAQMSDAEHAYVDSFPAWAVSAWALGVWAALLGSILLILRSRWAVAAFGLSLAGLAVTTVYQFVLSSPPESMKGREAIMFNVWIWIVAIVLIVYSKRMRDRGVLR